MEFLKEYGGTLGAPRETGINPKSVKITLNDSIAPAKRPGVETLVQTLIKAPQILWMPSRFPRYVMLVEPGPNDSTEPEAGSIFESPQSGTRSLATVTNFLEDRIKGHLAEKA